MSGSALARVGFAANTYAQPRGFGGGGSSLLWNSVANFAALTALPVPSSGANGLLVYVESVKDYFELDTNSSLTTTTATILATSLGGNTRWIRKNFPHPFWAQQAAWGINNSTGNDENIGSVASPLATWAEFMRRVGQGTVLPQTTSVTILSNLASTDPISGHLIVPSDVFLQIIGGVASTLQSGALTGVTALNRATNTAWILTHAGQDWTAEVGHRVRNTTAGPRLNAVSWVTRVDPAGGGALDTARVSMPALLPALNSGAIFGTNSSWVNGDTYAVEQLFTARLGDLWVEPQRGAVTAAFPTLVVSELQLGGGGAGVMPFTNGIIAIWQSCRFPQQFESNSDNVFSVNSCYAGALIVNRGMLTANQGAAIGLVGTGPAIDMAAPCKVELDNDYLVQGSIVQEEGELTIGTCGIFNAAVNAALNPTGAALAMATGSRGGPGRGAAILTRNGAANALYGASNAIGVHVAAGCMLMYQTLANLTVAGAAANAAFRLGINAATVDVLDTAGAWVNIATTYAALAAHDTGNAVAGRNLAGIVASL